MATKYAHAAYNRRSAQQYLFILYTRSSNAGSRNPKRCVFNPGSRSSRLHRLLSVASIYPRFTSKGGGPKQSEVHLAILDAHNSIANVASIVYKEILWFPDKDVVHPARLYVASHMPLSYLGCCAFFGLGQRFESAR